LPGGLEKAVGARVIGMVASRDGPGKDSQFGLVPERDGWRITGVTEPEQRGTRV